MTKEETIGVDIIRKIPTVPIGWLEIKLPKIVMMKLESYIETAKNDSIYMNSSLAGNLSKSLTLEDKDNWFFNNVLNSVIDKFMNSFGDFDKDMNILSENAPFFLEPFWVNFQKENEFNPVHDHSGLFSFVIWVKIPTDWKEQHALPVSANSNSPKTSNFEFWYLTPLGKHQHYGYFLDKNSEGTMLLFPAKLMHTVYPFYNCDKERISISGNIKFDISENSMRNYRCYKRKIERRKRKEEKT